MKSIYELIGIIKGIDFDDVINDMETEKLQTWVEKNRNLAFEEEQIKLISLLDDVLEDGIVTDEEKQTLYSYCEIIEHENNKKDFVICELNGIIAGIISDGVINESEIYALQNWMLKNKDFIRKEKVYTELIQLIEKILEDGVVTEEEQQEMLSILEQKIRSSQFEEKIVRLCRLIKERKNIGVELIDLLDDVNAMNEIHRRAKVELDVALASYTGCYVKNPEIVFISLTVIGMLSYDGNFYEHVRTVYENIYTRYSRQKIESLIRDVIKRYSEKDDTQIINSVLRNAIVPSNYLARFFDFVYDIYEINFGCWLPENLYDELKDVYEGLRENINLENDELEVNVTRKSYKLIKTTKQLITSDKWQDAIVNLSIIVIKLIDKKVWDRAYKIYNPYLKIGFEQWIKTYEVQNDLQKNREKYKSRWIPKYTLYENCVYLIPPVHKIGARYKYTDIRVCIYNGDLLLSCIDKPKIKEIIGGYQLDILPLIIRRPLGEITYVVKAGENVIYTSQSNLHRKYIVFDDEGKEISNNTSYKGTAVLCLNKNECGYQIFDEDEHYKIASISVKHGDYCKIAGETFNFTSFEKPGVYGEEYSDVFLKEKKTGKRIPVYQDILALIFECEDKYKELSVVINGNVTALAEYDVEKIPREDVTKYVVYLPMSEAGVYKTEIRGMINEECQRIASYIYAVDSSLNVVETALDNGTYSLMVTSDFFEVNRVVNFNINSFTPDIINVEHNMNSYIYEIPFDIKIYSISDSEWKEYNNPIWVPQLNADSQLKFYCKNVEKILVYAATGELLEEITKIKSNHSYNMIPISFLKTYSAHEYVLLAFVVDGKTTHGLFCYNRCSVDKDNTEIMVNRQENTLTIKVSYYGEGNVFAIIKDKNTDEIYCKTEMLESGKSVTVGGLIPFSNVTISICEKSKGLSLIKKERELANYSAYIYSWNDFVGKRFKVLRVYFEQAIKGEFVRKQHFFNRTYLDVIKKSDEGDYCAELYFETAGRRISLDNINPVNLEFCGEVEDGIEVSMTKDGDGLLLDFKNHGVMNAMDDQNGVDIFSYVIRQEDAI